MLKDLNTRREVLSGHAQGISLDRIHRITGVPKTTVKRIIDQSKASGLPIEQILQLSDAEFENLVEPARRTRMLYIEPDWELVYLNHERPRKALQLRVCWEKYCKRTEGLGKAMSYSTFCRAYQRYKEDLPASMHDVSMSFEWDPGKVAMIDYSGDPLYYTDPNGKQRKAEIFVGVMPFSNFIFCTATSDQTRQSWLLGCKAMLEYFGAVPEYIFLDNSTSLVTRADLYEPQYCVEFKGFAGYYGFSPLAVRPGKPRDKAAVEGAVGLVQRRITNLLTTSQFLSLDDVNSALRPLLEELNDRPLSEKSGTRRELFAEEKPVMQPLPEIPYELGFVEKTLKVRSDYQVRIHNRRFSVPFTYAGKMVRVRLWRQKNLLIVYDLRKGDEIARHHYDEVGPVQNIRIEHMPANHLMQLRSKEELLNRLKVIGSSTLRLGMQITRNQRELTARKILNGMLAVAKNAGNALVEEAAAAVLKRPEPTYDAYRHEIDRRMDTHTVEVSLGRGVRMKVKQDPRNIRGAGYYAKRFNEIDATKQQTELEK